ncbi:serine/threonine-protein kinase [Noviherbaspirillum sp. ST9]|uniref:serine/threonine-protein kinase n=1 Tax=Noviherbaspirillum sp. ST9 TaxID=3401606 RepID=UPI003B589D74
MASLAHAIRNFQGGGVSHNEFFAQVDRALAAPSVEPTKLLEILDDENTRGHLPPDVYAELQRRVERVVESTRGMNGNETRMRTSSLRSTMPPYVSGSETRYSSEMVDGLERIKGVGDTLNGRFVLEECIGFGGMGTVYKALDLRKLEASDRNPYIAIKVLNVQFRGHPKSLIALQREAKKAQALAHPNIVRVYDFDRDGPMVYLTMEYLTGGPLNRMLRAPGFSGVPYEEALKIIAGITKALSYAHERGFVHCDLKPANVFLTDNGDVKVIDFGIARVFHKPEEVVEATVFDPGSLGAMTPAYASPEMLENKEPDPRDDVYALACIAYELLTGHHPFDRVPATQARNSGLKPQRPQHLGNAPWKALRHALAFEREARTPGVDLFYKEISGSGGVPPFALIGGGVFAAALLATLAFNFYQGSKEKPAEEPPVVKMEEREPPAVATTPPTPVIPALTMEAVTPVLSRIPCSALVPSIKGNTLQVKGYLAGSGVAGAKETLGAIPGVQALNLDVRQVGDEKCGAIKLFAPYWLSNQAAGSSVSVKIRPARNELVEGDSVVLDLTTPGFESWVHVDYFSFDGSVLHMVPSPRLRANQAPPNYSATIGGGGNWVVAKPFGTDLIVLLTTPAPLFDAMRPEAEETADYLKAVEKQLKQIAAKHGRDKIMVDFLQITTRARKQ